VARDDQIKALAVRSLTKPLNLLPAAAVAGLGLALELWWLVLAGLIVYVVLVVTTFRSPAEARKVMAGTREDDARAPAPADALRDPAIVSRYQEAVGEERLIRDAVRASPMPVDDVEAELVGLKDELEALCLRAQRISDYLATIDTGELRRRRIDVRRRKDGAPIELAQTLARTESALDDQLATVDSLARQLERFHAESLGVVSTLGAIRGQVVRASVADSSGAERRVRDQLGDARQLVRVLTDELEAPTVEPGG
jgi:hypothetical protein